MGIIKDLEKRVLKGGMDIPGGRIHCQRWTAPLLGTTTKIHAAITGTGAALTVTTGITQPDFPRVLSITQSSTTDTGNIVITGTDIRGNVVTDTIAAPGSAATVNGVVAFASVTSILIPAGISSSTTISIGTTKLLGLEKFMYITKNGTNIATDMYISGSASGTFEATRATVTTSATAISLNTVAFNTALNGTLNFQANYITGELASKSYLTTA